MKRYSRIVRKTPLARSRTPIARSKKPINKISAKKAKEDVIYNRERIKFLKANPKCAIRKPGCRGRSRYVHHKKGRGKYYLDVSTWEPVCDGPCHDIITEHSKEAIEEGHSQRRNTPIERTIFYKRGQN